MKGEEFLDWLLKDSALCSSRYSQLLLVTQENNTDLVIKEKRTQN
jgi:hypothetical protein